METEIEGRVSTLEYRREDDVNSHNALCEIVNGLMKRVEDLESKMKSHDHELHSVTSTLQSDGGWIVGEPKPEMYPVGNPFDVTIERDDNGRRETIGRCWFSADGRIFNSDWCLSKVIAHRSAAPYAGEVAG